MVLQDIDNQAPDSFSEKPNPSDIDPYASPSSAGFTGGERFDATSLPRPIPVIGPFIGFSQRAIRFKTNTTLQFAEKKLGRTLHPEEAQALASHIYKLEKSKSYYTAGGAAGGVYRWYATMATYQYPFYKPKVESIDPNKFGPIKGPAANLARQTWRFGLYALVAGQMGNIIGSLIAQPIAAYETSVDPKLEEFGKELKAASGRDERSNDERGRLIEERRKEFEARRRQEGTGGMVPPYRGRQERNQAPPLAGADDDMSPTAGNEPWGTSGSSSWGDFASEEQPRPQPERQSADVRARRQPARQTPQPASASPSPFDDDASPTGGLFQSETQSTAQPSSRPAESSWDRLRRGASPPQQGGPQQDRTQRFASSRQSRSGAEESTAGDSQEARDAERERAQREFDQRLERERRGEDFSEGGEKKW